MIISDGTKSVEIKNSQWPIAEGLFLKWGYTAIENSVSVKNIDDITPELSSWGIPWRRTSWE